MKYIYIFDYFVILFSIIKLSSQFSYIRFPFKTSIKEKKEYPENLLQNDIEITLDIGTPPQKVDLNLRSKSYTFFVTSVEVNLPYSTFNDSNSKTLIKETKKPDTYGLQEYSKGYKIYESIYINGKEIANVSLIMATALNYKESGALGLRLVDSHEFGDDLSFIYQIKNLYNLYSYSFILKYKNNNEGELIIGAYPHKIDKKFNENYFYFTRAGTLNDRVDWILNFDLIKYNNKTINSINQKGFVQIEFGLIQAPFNLKQYFNEKFFNGQCTEKFNKKRNITIFHCDESLKISNFKNLTFILKDISIEFVLTYEDLFIKDNNEYIFGIVFDENRDNKEATWILGKPFMKKYELIYDLDRKIIATYKEVKDEKKSRNVGNLIYIIILIILCFIIIGLVIFIIIYIKNPRRKRAYELNDDNFEYFQTINS